MTNNIQGWKTKKGCITTVSCYVPLGNVSLTSVLWSVLSRSRRFLRVFLKPLDFGFSGLEAG